MGEETTDPLKPSTAAKGEGGELQAPRRALILPKEFKEEEVAKLDELITLRAGALAKPPAGSVARMLQLSRAINDIRRALTDDIMAYIMELQGCRLGFRTDKDKERSKDPQTGELVYGYPIDVVRDVTIEAMLSGANMTGNEVNIIASNAYLTKEFYQRRLAEFPGLTDLFLEISVPVLVGDKGAFVSYRATWKLNGHPDQLEGKKPPENGAAGSDIDTRVCIRVNAGMGTDAILGKAERKIRKKIFDRITGVVTRDGDLDDPPAPKHLSFEATPRSGEIEPPERQKAPIDFLKGVDKFIEACSTEAEVAAQFDKWSGMPLTGEQYATLTAWTEKRIQQINAAKRKQK